ncbi:hypothetical protein B0H16DRAFT_1745276 [Mycena metata]|uniref:Uncharacterized protein n=1 Tax=Mycena metata TaxID=1033252 RepID=A0AAD7MCV4_9AGAR|nr:hypothetical protein B0H16DRAFT_1745276 [Mycena metata]
MPVLVCLVLARMREETWPSYVALLHLLATTPSLQQLALLSVGCSGQPPKSFPPLHLPSLLSVNFAFGPYVSFTGGFSSLHTLLRHLRFPPLDNLRLFFATGSSARNFVALDLQLRTSLLALGGEFDPDVLNGVNGVVVLDLREIGTAILKQIDNPTWGHSGLVLHELAVLRTGLPDWHALRLFLQCRLATGLPGLSVLECFVHSSTRALADEVTPDSMLHYTYVIHSVVSVVCIPSYSRPLDLHIHTYENLLFPSPY